ncbi:phosphohydrolase [Synergistales bacterium]|nr:phosphohydrolase [Synergistales bacterium]
MTHGNGLLHIISHTDLDGVAAAAVAWYAHRGDGDPIKLSLTGYGEYDNLLTEGIGKRTRMITLDLSPQFQNTVDEIDKVWPEGEPPFVFDHHKTTFEKYKNRPWIVVDMDYCGALVYWNWLAANDEDAFRRVKPLENIVRVANDRDLWINEDPDGRLWQAMVTLCGEWGALARLMSNPDAAFTESEHAAVTDFVTRQEERFKRAKEHIIRTAIKGSDERFDFLGDGYLEFGDTSDFCGMLLDRPEEGDGSLSLVALAYHKSNGWSVSLRSKNALAGRVVSLLKDGKKIRGGGHGDAAALYFPNHYNENGIKDSIAAAISSERESSSGMGVTLGDLLKGSL